jgi:hypothetical protein
VAAEIIVGIALFAAGVLLRPYLERLLPLPGRMDRVEREISRLEEDELAWRGRHKRAMEKELQAIREEMAERGIYDSGIRLAEEDRVHRDFGEQLADHETEIRRRTEDLIHELNWWERRRFEREQDELLRSTFAALGWPPPDRGSR